MQKYHAHFYTKFSFQMSKLIMHLTKMCTVHAAGEETP